MPTPARDDGLRMSMPLDGRLPARFKARLLVLADITSTRGGSLHVQSLWQVKPTWGATDSSGTQHGEYS